MATAKARSATVDDSTTISEKNTIVFAHLLSKDRKIQLLNIARLLLIIETPVLWDGKNEDELTGDVDLGKITFDLDEAQNISFQALVQACDIDYSADMDGFLLNGIKALRLTRQNNTADRLIVGKEVIHALKDGKKIPNNGSAAWGFPSSARGASAFPFPTGNILAGKNIKKETDNFRIVLFEAIRFVIGNGELSESRGSLLQYIAEVEGVENEYFDDLLKQALAVQKEISKTINLILE